MRIPHFISNVGNSVTQGKVLKNWGFGKVMVTSTVSVLLRCHR